MRCNPQDTNALEALASLRAAVKIVRDPKDPKLNLYVDLGTFRKMGIEQLPKLADNHAALLEFGDFQLTNGFAKDLGVHPHAPRESILRGNGTPGCQDDRAVFAIERDDDGTRDGIRF